MQSTVDKDIIEQIKDWNPMRDAYNDLKFNKYMSGPGADLEDNLQPPESAKHKSQNQKRNDPYLVFRNVPDNLTVNGLLNICMGYGKPLRGSKDDKNAYFVNFATINDMERVFTGLQNNSYGFKVYLGNRFNKDNQTNNKAIDSLPNKSSFPTDKIDYDRSYQISSRNQPRPRFRKQPIVSKEDYDNPNNLLSIVDPQRHFLIGDDAYDLERLSYSKQNPVEDGKYNYHMGRAYYVMPQKDKRLIEEKQKSTIGSYDVNKDKFIKPMPSYDREKLGRCECCQKTCDIICSRCSAFFCSIECQTKQWPNHRFYCGKPPGLLSPSQDLTEERLPLKHPTTERQESPSRKHNDSTQRAALKSQLPESGARVMLTSISKTNVVFVRSTAYDDNLNFFNTVSTIQREAKCQRSLQHTPQRGDIVLTKFKDKQYNRAMVLNPDDLDSIKLIYIDYGNIDIKPLDELLDAPDPFWQLPRMAVPIILKDVPDFFMSDDVKKFMLSHLNTDLKIIYEQDDVEKGVHRAELFDLSSNESLNKTISSLRGTASELKKETVLFDEYLEHLPLPTGENVKLIVLDNSLLQTAFVSCTTETYAHAIQKFQDDIQKYANVYTKTETYTPRVNELCIAKYVEDDLWYRGRCIELVGDGHPTILFFDYGNISIVCVENIRKYPEEFTFPIMTSDCEISGLPNVITDELKKKLEDMLQPGTQLVCDKVVKFTESNCYTISLQDVLKKVLS